MYLIAGLGNPSRTYEGTRHNIGFTMIDAIGNKFGIDVTTKKHKALVGRGMIDGMRVILAKPQTYMNLSGESIREITDFYKIEPENIIIIYDDISLDVGQLRIRKKGSAGGHNGVKNIIAHLGTQEFPRIKVGIGNKPEGWDLADYVLSKYTKAEQEALEEASEGVIGAVKLMLMDDIEAAMNKYNAKKRDAR
ncbi:aminoacyl-tRNA hydrolase [Frisingicoccus caecimuris]|uniref:Peptidyl-tRNA hydrolase n=1 Tax=Frisingicoccus caecimuris TaxID=1796636 RepID=A0A4R2LHY2_9FIRM|nr:aminoacyl-tRNA hydrolase [Frisingicoccus caecimuris]MCR1919166.1 aminoacyl-tRNA hydrolase [Frisingicoccus caecimuris]TCO84642.1 PTH1 family peptidyl-tRNA hydrolase [Frisingicoccus caecimuris]HAP22092.1 aminoacyl-tRNA hydrolase [Lachnospiraceae bacterium]